LSRLVEVRLDVAVFIGLEASRTAAAWSWSCSGFFRRLTVAWRKAAAGAPSTT
jgi:hypothetical protein